MRIAVAGGHGAIALKLARLLTNRGDTVVSIVRNPDHVPDLRAVGAEPVVRDLEVAAASDLAGALYGADAVVFAAGAGAGSGVERKDTVDRAAAGLLADAAGLAGVGRYLLVSSMGAGAEPPDGTDEVFAAYLRAKTAAEDDLRSRSLTWTIVRPGHLTDEQGTGRVLLSPGAPRGDVPRDDVAAVLVAVLDAPSTTGGRTYELVGGETPISDLF